MKFKTKEQQIVVENRVKQGYSAEEVENGDWLVIKGKHTMLINCIGYDAHIPGRTYKVKEVN